jgi:hypothetical protein
VHPRLKTPALAIGIYAAMCAIVASTIIVWMLSTLSMAELAAAALLVAVAGIGYSLQAVWPVRPADHEATPTKSTFSREQPFS